MKPKKIWANLAVSDTERAAKFYTALGFKKNGKHSKELVSFCFGDDNFIIHFFVKERLQSNMKVELVDPQKTNEIMFTLSAESKEEVDEWLVQAEKAGGTIITKTAQFEKGFFCVFADPDGHKFNALFWPS